MIFLVQGQIVEHEACPVEYRFAAAKVLHGHDDEIRNLTDACIEHFHLASIPDLAKLLEYLSLKFSHFFSFFGPSLSCWRGVEKGRSLLLDRVFYNSDMQLNKNCKVKTHLE